jgi:hypothetical protein
MSTRTQTETVRIAEPIGATKWIAWAVAAALAITIGAMYVTGTDRVAPTSSGTAGTEVTRSAPEATQPTGSGVPAYRTELIKGGLQPAPFAAIVTPNDVPAFEARFSGRTEGSSPSAKGITLIKGGLQPRPFGNG